MDKSGRFRKKKPSFSMIPNEIIRNENISLRAKGLYSLIQSYITMEEFTLYKSFLVRKCKEGKAAFDTAWKELKETGYLKQYKMNSESGFYYEYELLDSPDTDFPGLGNPGMETPGLGNRGHINNTIPNNTLLNNTDQIISINDVMDQIGYKTFADEDRLQVTEIAMLILDVLNSPDNMTIWIAKKEMMAAQVKERFRQLNQFHVAYVLECLRENTSKISAIKHYILTALYNAPTTMTSYYENKVNSQM